MARLDYVAQMANSICILPSVCIMIFSQPVLLPCWTLCQTTDGTCSPCGNKGLTSKAKKPLKSIPLSPQEQLLSTTAMKAQDNRGIPTTAPSLVGSRQLTQVGVRGCPSFEGCLLRGMPPLWDQCPALAHGAASEKSPGGEYLPDFSEKHRWLSSDP